MWDDVMLLVLGCFEHEADKLFLEDLGGPEKNL